MEMREAMSLKVADVVKTGNSNFWEGKHKNLEGVIVEPVYDLAAPYPSPVMSENLLAFMVTFANGETLMIGLAAMINYDLMNGSKASVANKCLVHLGTGTKLHFHVITTGDITRWALTDDLVGPIPMIMGDIFEEEIPGANYFIPADGRNMKA
jgi:hypothetical protein